MVDQSLPFLINLSLSDRGHDAFTERGRETLRALDISVQRRVKTALKQELSKQPTLGKPLLTPLEGFLSFSVGDYRIIYSVDATQLVVYRVGHRDRVYELMAKQLRRISS